MGWSHCGEDSKGRPIGYAHEGVCDHQDCNKKIDRGLSYACGGMHGETEFGCEGYFCEDHLDYTVVDGDQFINICETCMVRLTTSGAWALNPEHWTVERIRKVTK